jgi:uncharacterized protein YigA (DUF484 family)
LKAEDVAQYLRDHPDFFEQYADMLAEIYVPHPHGGRAIPLSDRQVLTLRERTRALESRLSQLLQIGEENDAIGEKIHRLCLALLFSADRSSLLAHLYLHLREDFAVPHSALRIWGGAGEGAEFQPVDEDLKRYAASLTEPFCGPNGSSLAGSWFGEDAPHVRSVALVSLRDKECFGMLALGSEDASRFYPEMGTLYLKRLGELASAALTRLL